MDANVRLEMVKQLAELKPQVDKAWADLQAYEESTDYQSVIAKHQKLSDEWYKLQITRRALEAVLS